ncbi:radical SAM protein [Petrotoga sp. 9PWA.NaAc.5.4]|uniref:SPL family radical SAM protein n=1 Tax=Petrotoga sp. 9PWA.NaAc.5.4 TaxID=1434328 RepID=UPI00268C6EB3
MSKMNFINKIFSHIYVEVESLKYQKTYEILNKFKQSKVVYIDNYKELFSRKNQNPTIQKISPSLIIAVKQNEFIYQGSRMCQDFDQDNFYYTNFILNCLFECDYCYLKGMNLSSNIVFFVNLEDYFREIKQLTAEDKKIYLSISYDSDILLFDGILDFLEDWMDFAYHNPKVTIEIRTKSSTFKKFFYSQPIKNLIISSSILPQSIIDKYEKNTPNLEKRLNAVSKLINLGWKINLAIDPVIYDKDAWQNEYQEFFDTLSKKVDLEKVNAITIGTFRIPTNYLKRLKKFSFSPIAFYTYQTDAEVASYPKEIKNQMIDFIKTQLETRIKDIKIYII